jgi:hypothetical protein
MKLMTGIFGRRAAGAWAFRGSPEVTIRWATSADAPALEVLAEIEEAPVPPAPLLLGVVDGELWVAMSARRGEAICDPFRPSLEVAMLVRERTRQLTVPERDRARLIRTLKPRRSSSASVW